VVIGEEISEQLDIVPAKIQVLVNVRKKYACRQCESGVITAPLPAQPIPKSNASPGLLAHIVTAKYQDALPLHRQETILHRHGIDIPRNTLASWMIKAGEQIQPLLNLLQDKLLAYPIMHCDETTVQVLNEQGKRAQSKSYMWVRVGGPPTQPIRLFHYADSRSGDVASHLLEGYEGYLQTDDYAGYNLACAKPAITQLGCWAHARRKFVEAQKVAAGTTGKADLAIAMIAKLYAIEKRIQNSDPQERHVIRQQEAVPQLNQIRQWLDKTLHRTLPKGALGKALAYLEKNWGKLTVYTEDGRLSIDNNPAENAIRPFVLGRKNWIFSASVDGAKASANLYGLIETAKANNLEPYDYLKKVFKELPSARSVEAIEALLPWNQAARRIAVTA
jgi:transposase